MPEKIYRYVASVNFLVDKKRCLVTYIHSLSYLLSKKMAQAPIDDLIPCMGHCCSISSLFFDYPACFGCANKGKKIKIKTFEKLLNVY